MECLRGILQRERYVFSASKSLSADQALYTRTEKHLAGAMEPGCAPPKKKRKLYLTA